MKTITLECTTCNKPFEKAAKEYNRQLKNGNTRFFCNLSCATIKRNEENPSPGNIANLQVGRKKDEYTPFRWFVLRAQYRANYKRKYNCNITVQYLKQLWEEQKGICPFTGWNLVLPEDSDGCKKYLPTNASLDRIDNTLGYVEGNLRFISVMANIARQTFSDEQLITFCKAVANK